METETKQKIRLNTMAIILIIILCIGISPKTLQNDTYYTIKIGEYVLENGITMVDPFSWHENLEYTFPHWLYDVMIYSIYNIGGMLGVYISTIVFASILGIVIYFVNVKLCKNRILSFALTIISLILLKPYICARAQLVTFILFILTIYFIEMYLDTKKKRYIVGLVIIPILIANLHTATFFFYFILYLPYIAEYISYILIYADVVICEAVQKSLNKKLEKNGESEKLLKKIEKEEKRHKKLKERADAKIENPYKIKVTYKETTRVLILIFIICLLTGFLTPIGTTPYTYLIKTMQGISTKNISEHLPLVLSENRNLLILLAVYITLIAFTKIKIRISDVFMLGGLVLLAIFTRRQASMVYLIGCIILNRLLTQLINNYNDKIIKKVEKLASSIIGIAVISVIIILISLLAYKAKKDDDFIDGNTYPVQAIQWLKENLDINSIRIYNEYNYGSYFIYQNIPVFIDSRCDLYMPEFNENMYAFRDFLRLNDVKDSNETVENKFEEYGFTHFVVTNTSRIKRYLEERPEKYNKIYPTEEISDDRFSIFERISKNEE